MCMYKHNDENHEIDDKDKDGDDNDSDCSDVDMKKLNPVLEKVKKTVKKYDTLGEQCSFKCKICDFEAKDRNGLFIHTKAKHATKANQVALK